MKAAWELRSWLWLSGYFAGLAVAGLTFAAAAWYEVIGGLCVVALFALLYAWRLRWFRAENRRLVAAETARFQAEVASVVGAGLRAAEQIGEVRGRLTRPRIVVPPGTEVM